MRRVLDAAAQQFIQLGFERTSLDSVAQASGVSKMTIYSYFASKELLFEACVEERCAGLFDVFSQDRIDPAQPQQALERIGTLFLKLLRDEGVLAVHRMMYASASTHPELCQRFYQQGPERSHAYMQQFLVSADQCGSLCVPDPAAAADQFLALFLGRAHCGALLGLGTPAADADAQLVQDNVATFLRAFASPAA